MIIIRCGIKPLSALWLRSGFFSFLFLSFFKKNKMLEKQKCDICHLHYMCAHARARVWMWGAERERERERERESVSWPIVTKWVVMMRSYNIENYRDNTNKWHTRRLWNRANTLGFVTHLQRYTRARTHTSHCAYLHASRRVGGLQSRSIAPYNLFKMRSAIIISDLF